METYLHFFNCSFFFFFFFPFFSFYFLFYFGFNFCFVGYFSRVPKEVELDPTKIPQEFWNELSLYLIQKDIHFVEFVLTKAQDFVRSRNFESFKILVNPFELLKPVIFYFFLIILFLFFNQKIKIKIS